MSYHIIPIGSDAIHRINHFQLGVARESRAIPQKDSVNDFPLEPTAKSVLEYTAQLRLLYAAECIVTNRILGFLVAFPAGLCVPYEDTSILHTTFKFDVSRYRRMYKLAQHAVAQPNVLVLHALIGYRTDQRNILSSLLAALFESLRKTHYYSHALYVSKENPMLYHLLPRMSFELSNTIVEDSRHVNIYTCKF